MLSGRLVMALAVVVAVCLASWQREASLRTSLPPPEEHRPARLDPRSNPLAIVYDAFLAGGYGPHTAIAHAHRALGLPYPDVVIDEPTEPGAALLHPGSCPLAILFDAFIEGGWSPEEAIRHAASALNMQPTGNECQKFAVRVTITFCDGGDERYVQGWLNNRCYEDPDGDPFTADGLQICDMFACQQDQYRWISLTVASSCGELPAAGTCVQLRKSGTAVQVACETVLYDCNCFQETYPVVNCASIESCCCSSPTAGCNGCPSCSGGCPPP